MSEKPSVTNHHSVMAKGEFMERSLEIYCLCSWSSSSGPGGSG